MALLRAHCLASAGAAAAITGALLHSPFIVVAVSVLAAMTTDRIIDAFGHSHIAPVPTRTPTTHSITTAPIWALLVSLAATLIASTVSAWLPFLAQLQPATLALPAVAACQAAALIHLLLDSLTGKGIYVPAMIRPAAAAAAAPAISRITGGRKTHKKKERNGEGEGGRGHYRRWGLAHNKYNAPAPTLLALLIGIAGAYAYARSFSAQTFTGAGASITAPWTILAGMMPNPWTSPNILTQLAAPLAGQTSTTIPPAPMTTGLSFLQGIPVLDQTIAQFAAALYSTLSIQAVKWPLILMLTAVLAVEAVPRLLSRRAPRDAATTSTDDWNQNEDWKNNDGDGDDGDREEESAASAAEAEREKEDDAEEGVEAAEEDADRDPLPRAQPPTPEQYLPPRPNRNRIPTVTIKLRMLCGTCGAPKTEPPGRYCDKCGAPADTDTNPPTAPPAAAAAATAAAAAATPSSPPRGEAARSSPPAVFCAMCGKEHALREEYCDRCGAQLDKSAIPGGEHRRRG